MSKSFTLVVGEDDAPDRLDHFIAERLSDVSRTRAHRLVVEGHVTLNEQPAKPSSRLSAGDIVKGELPETASLEAAPEDIPVTVVHEDDEIIVVDKPAGMVVHPAPGSPSGTLVNALLWRGTQLSSGGDTLRPGIVHRLDKDTSGLIVVAKTDSAHAALGAEFESRNVSKVYLALVWGVFSEDEGRVEEPLGRSPRNRKRMAVVSGGKPAATAWRVRESFPYASLLEARPETGRTHQIRVHLNHLSRPVMGDADYGGVKSSFGDVPPHYRREAKRATGLAGRQMLHARSLAFPHPSDGKPVRFVSPLPDDFALLLSTLRRPEGESGRIIALDPGEARVGVAVSDESRMLARPLVTLEGLGDSGVAKEVSRLCGEMDVHVIVVGNPIRMDGSTGPRSARARELAVVIEDATLARVVLRDERLSSVEAERIMRERGERARGRKGRVDELAASVILQGYLDSL